MKLRVEIGLYALVAAAAVAPALRTGHIVGDGADAFGTGWFYAWIHLAVTHLGDPSFTDRFFFPFGKEIFAHTGNNFVDAVLSVPFQMLFGADHYAPAFIFVVLMGNAVTFRVLARYCIADPFSAFAATLLWMVNPFTLFELTAGRPTQAFLWTVPGVVLYALRVSSAAGRFRDAVWLGLAMALTGQVYWFYIYFLALFLLPLLIARVREPAVLGRFAVAVGVTVLLTLPSLLAMRAAIGTGGVPGVGEAGGWFDLPQGIGNNVAAELHGSFLMETRGAPLLLQPAWLLPLGFALPAANRLPGGRWPWILGVLTALLFSIGPVVRLSETTYFRNFPYLAWYHLDPFFQRLWFPYRLVMVIFLALSLCFGLLARTPGRLGMLVVVGLLGQAFTGVFPLATHDGRPPAVVRVIPEHTGGIVTLPMRVQSDWLLWQTRSWAPLFGGMGESAPAFWPAGFKERMNQPIVRALRSASIGKKAEFTPSDSLQAWGFRWVVWRRDLADSEATRAGSTASFEGVSTVLGRQPAAAADGVIVWDLSGALVAPAELAPTAEHLNAPFPDSAPPLYLRRLAWLRGP